MKMIFGRYFPVCSEQFKRIFVHKGFFFVARCWVTVSSGVIPRRVLLLATFSLSGFQSVVVKRKPFENGRFFLARSSVGQDPHHQPHQQSAQSLLTEPIPYHVTTPTQQQENFPPSHPQMQQRSRPPHYPHQPQPAPQSQQPVPAPSFYGSQHRPSSETPYHPSGMEENNNNSAKRLRRNPDDEPPPPYPSSDMHTPVTHNSAPGQVQPQQSTVRTGMAQNFSMASQGNQPRPSADEHHHALQQQHRQQQLEMQQQRQQQEFLQYQSQQMAAQNSVSRTQAPPAGLYGDGGMGQQPPRQHEHMGNFGQASLPSHAAAPLPSSQIPAVVVAETTKDKKSGGRKRKASVLEETSQQQVAPSGPVSQPATPDQRFLAGQQQVMSPF